MRVQSILKQHFPVTFLLSPFPGWIFQFTDLITSHWQESLFDPRGMARPRAGSHTRSCWCKSWPALDYSHSLSSRLHVTEPWSQSLGPTATPINTWVVWKTRW